MFSMGVIITGRGGEDIRKRCGRVENVELLFIHV
jgi:hypothetical protein